MIEDQEGQYNCSPSPREIMLKKSHNYDEKMHEKEINGKIFCFNLKSFKNERMIP